MNKIDLSIIICAYNADKYLIDTLSSIKNQTSLDDFVFEVILVDDGSTDKTAKIAKNHSLVYLYQENLGIEAASQKGFDASRGKFIMRLDADDRLHPDFLLTLQPFLKVDEADFYYGNYSIIDQNGSFKKSITLPAFDQDEIRERGDFLATGTVYRRSLLTKFGFYRTRKRNCGLENYELILNLISDGCVGVNIQKEIFEYRIHPDNLSSNKLESILEYGRLLASRFGLAEYKTNEFHPYELKI